MAEGLYRGWDELRTVPRGQQSSLRVLVLFTDARRTASPVSTTAHRQSSAHVRLSRFCADVGGQTLDKPKIAGLFDTRSGSNNPSFSLTTTFWNSTHTSFRSGFRCCR